MKGINLEDYGTVLTWRALPFEVLAKGCLRCFSGPEQHLSLHRLRRLTAVSPASVPGEVIFFSVVGILLILCGGAYTLRLATPGFSNLPGQSGLVSCIVFSPYSDFPNGCGKKLSCMPHVGLCQKTFSYKQQQMKIKCVIEASLQYKISLKKSEG